MNAGAKKRNGFDESHEDTLNEDAIGRAEQPQDSGVDIPRGGAESVLRLGLAPCAASTPTPRDSHPEFRTEAAVGDLTVRGVLPGTAQLPVGSVAICGDVHLLSCDEALELVDALLLVVMRMDVVVEERYSTTIDATRDREG